MKMKKCLLLLLAICLTFSTLCIGVAAHTEESTTGTGVFGTNWSVGEFVSLCIAAAVLLVVAVLCIVKREKLKEALRAYRSEMKKITWYPWKQVWRNTILVIVIVGVTAAVLGLLDYAFFQAQIMLAKIV